MRLDEWQKFIEAQFLEAAPEPPAPPVLPALPFATTGQPERPEADSLSLSETLDLLETPKAVVSEPPPSVPAKPQPPGFIRSSASAPASSSPRRAAFPRGAMFEPAVLTEIEVPNFETYFPTLQPEASPVLETSPSSPEPVHAIVTSREEKESPSHPTPRTIVRRTPHSRPKNGQEPPGEAPAPTALVEMWAKVPHVLQTLLALERMEESEAAQASYKRPFSESRRELLERIFNPVLTLEETARLLNVCPTTVRRYTNQGLLTCYRKEAEGTRSEGPSEKETRQRRFRLSDILAFLETQQATLAADQP